MKTQRESNPSSCRILAPRLSPRSETLGDVLRRRAERQGDALAFTWLVDGEDQVVETTYSELDRRARAIAAELQKRGKTGERAMLVYDPGPDYIAALFGCLMAGTTAVPVYPPDPMRIDRTLPRLQAIIRDCHASILLSSSDTLGWGGKLFAQIPGLRGFVATDELCRDGIQADPLRPDFEKVAALLQYTSGSTGDAKGVVIPHASLMANLRQIHFALDLKDAVAVSWLPAYHDMGLIGGIFQPIFSGRACVLMAPMSFMQRPVRWLKAMSRYRATTTAAPNFAYDLCVRKITPEEAEGLDLSHWRLAMSGAERIRVETLDRFEAAFQKYGFRRGAFLACYGMAETTLFVSGGQRHAGPKVISLETGALAENRVELAADDVSEPTRLVSCGLPGPREEVIIVDPADLRQCPENRVGEIWTRGPNVGAGYWNRPEETRGAFQAYTEAGDGPYLRTGDLGFLHEGEVVVAGRLKEMIIVRGRNYYPQDIERTVEHVDSAIKTDGGAAFAIEWQGAERLVIVQEVTRPKRLDLPRLLTRIRAAIAQDHDLAPLAIVLIRSGALPKTSSGKIQRRLCRELFLQERLRPVAVWTESSPRVGATPDPEKNDDEPTPTERWVTSIWEEVLREKEIGLDDGFFELGGNSLLATQLVSRLRSALGRELPIAWLFESPTIREFSARLDRQRPEWERVRVGSVSKAPADERPSPSFSQRRLWYLEQVDPTPRYNVQAAIHFRGEIDLTVLRASLQHVVDRHEILKSAYPTRDGHPEMVFRDVSVELPEFDLRDLPKSDQDEALGHLTSEWASQPFDLAQGPLFRGAVVRLSNRFVFSLACHHIVCDGWSMRVFLDDLSAAYATLAAGGDPARTAPLLSIGYADFAAWQRREMEEGRLESEWSYWKHALSNAPESLTLPTDRPRSADRPYQAGLAKLEISESLTRQLEEFARSRSATPFMALLAVFQELLARFSGQDDILVGTTVAARDRIEWERLVGFFANTLTLRTDLSDRPSFRQLLDRVRETALAAYAHQGLPFEKLVELARPRRLPGETPLFQAMFVYEDALPDRSVTLGSATSTKIEVDYATMGSFDVTLAIEPRGGKLECHWVYNASLFDAATADSMLSSFGRLLESLVHAPDRSVRMASCLPPVSVARLAHEWRGPTSPLPTPPIRELISRQAEQNPEAVAIQAGDRALTFRELEASSWALSQELLSLGARPSEIVAICLPRSIDAIVAMLGIWKANLAYQPLDPTHPVDRLALLTADSSARFVVTWRRFLPALAQSAAAPILMDAGEAWTTRDSTPVDRKVTPFVPTKSSDLAYLLHTSGSTGEPKGVEIEHGAIANHAIALAKAMDLSAGDRLLHSITLTFDAAGEQIWPTLISGATLVILEEDHELSGPAIATRCMEDRITHLHLPTALWEHCVEAFAEKGPDAFGIESTLVGGDSPLVTRVEAWRHATGPSAIFLHAYGLTEATITSTLHKFEGTIEGQAEKGARLPLGRPLANTAIALLDRDLRPVPPGAVGEICVAGMGLARGYRDREEQTSARFVLAPSSPDGEIGAVAPGERLLKTGDLGRIRSDGELEFLGRADQQLKIRGLRVEPGEVEAVLSRHPAVRQVAVVGRPVGSNRATEIEPSKQLVAFVVPPTGVRLCVEELREFALLHLPATMAPAIIVPLEAMPLTATKKLDRGALKTIELPQPEANAGDNEPTTENEKILASIWRDTLRLGRVGTRDNFFELGGDSIISIQVTSRAREAGLRVSPRQIYRFQTIGELARVADEAGVECLSSEAKPGETPLSPIQRWFFREYSDQAGVFQQVIALGVRSELRAELVEKALRAVAERHDVFRSRFERGSAGWRQIHAPDAKTVEWISVPERGRDAERRAKAEASRPFDLTRGPLLRAIWSESQVTGNACLTLAAHHLVIDGVSWRILVEDLEAACRQFSRGETHVPPAKTSSFQAWSKSLVEWAESLESGHDENEAAVPPLPRDFDGPNLAKDQGVVSVSLDKRSTAMLREIAGALGPHGMECSLLAALQSTLADWTGQDRFAIDLESHGRAPRDEDLDLTRTIGWFTTMFPVTLDAEGVSRPGDAVARVMSQLDRATRGDLLRHGVEHSVKEFLRGGQPQAPALSKPEVGFNYLGVFENQDGASHAFRWLDSDLELAQAENAKRVHLLDLAIRVQEGTLRVDWSFSRAVHRRETISRLASAYVEALLTILDQTRDRAEETPTQSLTLIDAGEFEKLAGLLDQLDRRS